MKEDPSADATAAFERLLAEHRQEKYVFRLYVAGMTTLSMIAVAALKSLCEQHLAGRYELDVINLAEHPELAQEQDIIAAPTLIKESPPPPRRLVGDLTQRDRVLLVLQ